MPDSPPVEDRSGYDQMNYCFFCQQSIGWHTPVSLLEKLFEALCAQSQSVMCCRVLDGLPWLNCVAYFCQKVIVMLMMLHLLSETWTIAFFVVHP